MKSLIERMRLPYIRQHRNYGEIGQPTAYADRTINDMTNVELVDAISTEIDAMLEELKEKL